jgi:hypothetical protein
MCRATLQPSSILQQFPCFDIFVGMLGGADSSSGRTRPFENRLVSHYWFVESNAFRKML